MIITNVGTVACQHCKHKTMGIVIRYWHNDIPIVNVLCWPCFQALSVFEAPLLLPELAKDAVSHFEQLLRVPELPARCSL